MSGDESSATSATKIPEIRGTELLGLEYWLSLQKEQPDRNILNIFGPNGIGKTWLTDQFIKVYRHRFVAIVVLDAKDIDCVAHILLNLLQGDFTQTHSGLSDDDFVLRPDQADPDADIPLLLVLDNFDERLRYDESEENLIRVLFEALGNSQSSVLVLSNNELEQIENRVELAPLKPHESLNLLCPPSSQESVLQDLAVEELADKLQHFPLAIAVAASYLSNTSVDVGTYTSLFEQESELSHTGNWETVPPEFFGTYAVLLVSLRKIEERQPLAAKLLRFLAYFHHQDIDTSMLLESGGLRIHPHFEVPGWWSDLTQNEADFDRAITILESFHIVRVEKRVIQIHKSVQSWIVDCVITRFDQDNLHLAKHCVYSFAEVYSHERQTIDVPVKRQLMRHFRHLDLVKHYMPESPEPYQHAEEVNICIFVADVCAEIGSHTQALVRDQSLLETIEDSAGKYNPESSWMIVRLAKRYMSSRKFKEAETILRDAAQAYKSARGQPIPAQQAIWHTLGLLLEQMKKPQEAEDAYVLAVQATGLDQLALRPSDVSKAVSLSSNYELLFESMTNLALLYLTSDRSVRSRKLFRRVLELNARLSTINPGAYGFGASTPIPLRIEKLVSTAAFCFVECVRLNFNLSGTIIQRVHYLCEALEFAKHWGKDHKRIWSVIGRLLLVLRDESNATKAFSSRKHNKSRDGASLICDLCRKAVGVDDHYICRECDDCDLCMKCFNAVQNGEEEFPSCNDHNFFRAYYTQVQGQVDNAADLWLEKALEQYVKRGYGETFKYKTLPTGSDLRLLSFEPYSSDSSIITIHLNTYSTDDSPVYTAISYTWEKSLLDAQDGLNNTFHHGYRIRVNNRYKHVTENLYEALLSLQKRCAEPSMLFWIDALCINQDDLKERSSQVAKMDQIYQSAEKVIVYLGCDNPYTASAMRIVSKLGLLNESEKDEIDALDIDDLDKYPDVHKVLKICGLEDVIRDDEDWKSLQYFFSLSWFTRLWVVQETVFAGSSTEIVLGTMVFPMFMVHMCVVFLVKVGLPRIRALTDLRIDNAWQIFVTSEAIPSAGDTFGTVPWSLTRGYLSALRQNLDYMSLLLGMCHCIDRYNCKDPRDKIYAVKALVDRQALAASVPLENIKIDYEQPVVDLYRDISRRMIQSKQGLSFLSAVDSQHTDRIKELPSWARDFHHNKTWEGSLTYGMHVLGHSFSADVALQDLDLSNAIRFNDLSQLLVEGLQLGSVKSVFRGFPVRDRFLDDVEGLTVFLQDLSDDYKFTRQTVLDALWRTLTADLIKGQHPAATDNRADFTAWLVYSMNQSTTDPNTTHEFLVSLIHDCGLWDRDEVKEMFAKLRGEIASDSDEGQDAIRSFLPFINRAGAYVQAAGANATTRGHRPIALPSGLIGMGVIGVEQGDTIWILPSAGLPMIFRDVGNGTHRFIGDAYIHGVMHGEASKWFDLQLQTITIA